MNSIRAFVGHSFNEADAVVVRAFLEFLDGVVDASPGFSWKHAERPEPKIVTEKVLELLEDRNVFIGICTRKEQVVAEGALKPAWLRKDRYTVRLQDLEWKASDWVIQEIGLAIGRGLKVVLLLEDGVRLPGSLQGNLEYISFDRAVPQRAFNKLLLMLTSPAPSIEIVGESSRPAEIEIVETIKAAGGDEETPDASWQQSDFEFGLLRAIASEMPELADQIDIAYHASPLFTATDNAICWDAYKKYAYLRFGKKGEFSGLKDMAQQHPASARIQDWVGRIYNQYDEFDEAANWFQRAASSSANDLDKLRYLQRASKARYLAGHLDNAQSIIQEMKEISSAAALGEDLVLKANLEIAPKSGGDEAAAASLERLLEMNPVDHNTRFTLAYKYSEMGLKDLCLLHYSRIQPADRNSVTWNNLGVALSESMLPGKSIEAYQEAERLGETLAMSNLAYKLIGAGFLKEASEICKVAMQIPDHHKNVDEALAKLKDTPEEENKREVLILERARKASAAYREAGKAMAAKAVTLPNEWQGPDCKLALNISNGHFKLTGTYSKPERIGLQRLMISGNAPTEQQRTYKLEYAGTMVGRAFFGTVSRKADGDTTILGAFASAPTKVLMWVDAGANRIQIVEFTSDDKINEITLTLFV